MSESELNRAVARVTKESVETIRRMGFSLVKLPRRRGRSRGRRRCYRRSA